MDGKYISGRKVRDRIAKYSEIQRIFRPKLIFKPKLHIPKKAVPDDCYEEVFATENTHEKIDEKRILDKNKEEKINNYAINFSSSLQNAFMNSNGKIKSRLPEIR